MATKLYRSRENRLIAGVCGGLAEYLDLDPNLIRVVLLLLVALRGAGLLAYVIAWVILPEKE